VGPMNARTERALRVVDRLTQDGVVRRVAPGEGQLFADCDLASSVQSRFQVVLDPRQLDPAARASWTERALDEGRPSTPPEDDEHRVCCWVLEGGTPAGTLALPSFGTTGSAYLDVYSLYVFPELRRTGVARRVLQRLAKVAVEESFGGLKLASEWISTAAVRFYLHGLGLWVRSFKRSIDFVWDPRLSGHQAHVGVDEASFRIVLPSGPTTVIEASRQGDGLVWHALPALQALEEANHPSAWLAESTFAVALALAGWPLLQAGDDLTTGWRGDLGGPDVLAYKIAQFEWWARKQGHQLHTPRIPGLPYEKMDVFFDAD
jgi:GNAT superfamily N-acetyltransferase